MDKLAVSDIEPHMVDPRVFPVMHIKEEKVTRLQSGQGDGLSLKGLIP